MDRKDEIIKLQMDVIQQMTESNLKRIADDLWGLPTLQAGGEPVVKQKDVTGGRKHRISCRRNSRGN